MSNMPKFSKQIGHDPDTENDIVQTGEQYTFLTKSANKQMWKGKSQRKAPTYIVVESSDTSNRSPVNL